MFKVDCNYSISYKVFRKLSCTLSADSAVRVEGSDLALLKKALWVI